MPTPTLLDWIGYIASVLVLISLVMTSIVRLRWINLMGSAIFAVYGFLIHSIPTGFMNTVIVFVNIHFLIKFYRSKEYFSILNTQPQDQYLIHFLDFYQQDIHKYYPHFSGQPDSYSVSFYVLRNMATAGLFLGQRVDDQTLQILLDYATPAYRDLKVGRFIYIENEGLFRKLGYHRLWALADNEEHTDYLKRMGFSEDPTDKNRLVKTIA